MPPAYVGEKLYASNEKSSSSSSTKSKRRRLQYSCRACHKRKERCDRQKPCSNCTRRRKGTQCRYDDDEDDDVEYVDEGVGQTSIAERLVRLENLVKRNTEMLTRVVEGESRHPLRRSTDRLIAGAPTTEVNQDKLQEQINGLIETSLHTESSRGKTSEDHVRQATTSLTDPNRQLPISTSVDEIMSEYSGQSSYGQHLIEALPERKVCEAMVDHFIGQNNWLRQPLSRKMVTEGCNVLWEVGPKLTLENINVCAMVLMIAALATLTYPHDHASSSSSNKSLHARIAAKRYFFSARQCLLISTMLGRQDQYQAIAYHWACRFSVLQRRISDAWSCMTNAVKASFAIGLHRDPSESPRRYTVEQCIHRRRIWSNIFYGERLLCMNLGQPSCIDDRIVSTQAPSRKDVYGEFEEYLRPRPGSLMPSGVQPPDFLAFLQGRHTLGMITGDILLATQSGTLQQPSTLFTIDSRLNAFRAELADHLRSTFVDGWKLQHDCPVWDSVFEFAPVHRYIIQAEILFVRMMIHRPSLFGASRGVRLTSQESIESTVQQSRQSCVEAAYQMLEMRADLTKIVQDKWGYRSKEPDWVRHLGAFNLMAAVVILGVYLLTDGNFDDEMFPVRIGTMMHLRSYYERKNAHEQLSSENGTMQEYMIIRTFCDRVVRARAARGESGRQEQRNARPSHLDPASGMQQSETRSTADNPEALLDQWFASNLGGLSSTMSSGYADSTLVTSATTGTFPVVDAQEGGFLTAEHDSLFWNNFIDQVLNTS